MGCDYPEGRTQGVRRHGGSDRVGCDYTEGRTQGVNVEHKLQYCYKERLTGKVQSSSLMCGPFEDLFWLAALLMRIRKRWGWSFSVGDSKPRHLYPNAKILTTRP